MSGSSYSPEDMARIRAGYLAMEPLADIAAAVGRSAETVRQKARRMGLSSEGHQRRHSRARMEERHQVQGYTAALHEAARAPDALAKRAATMKAVWSQPGYREHARIRRERAWAVRRGFAVPLAVKDDYDRLIRKKFTALEAGVMLGLLPKEMTSYG